MDLIDSGDPHDLRRRMDLPPGCEVNSPASQRLRARAQSIKRFATLTCVALIDLTRGVVAAENSNPSAAPVTAQTSPTLDLAFNDALGSVIRLESVVINARPSGQAVEDLTTPAEVLDGSRLDARRATTVGEMLSGLPGVSASAFGPNASRPIIRGLDGDRLKVLTNGVPLLDASAASPDHAVAAEPLLLDRVEVLRGAAALRFGGGAMGGVVNLVDNRIPQEPMNALAARVDLRLGGAAHESAAAARATGGDGRVAWSATALDRRSGDLAIPGFARTAAMRAAGFDALRDPSGHQANSASQAQGATLGVARTATDNFWGLAVSQLTQRYGTTQFEEGLPVTIRMEQTRLDAAGRQAGVAGGSLAVMGAMSQYRHAEIAAGVVGTEFRHQGGDVRLEWTRLLGTTRWVVGAQVAAQEMAVTGAEAFLPSTQSRQNGLYVLADRPLQENFRLEAGARIEHAAVRSMGGHARGDWVLPAIVTASGDADLASSPGMAALARNFSLGSYSLGGIWTVSAGQSLALRVNHTERAPNAQELFADGPHVATALYELGNPQLGAERANGVDLGWRRRVGPWRAGVDLFAQQFDQWIGLRTIGAASAGGGTESMTAAAFSAGPARFRGAEFTLGWTALETAGRRLLFEAGHDQVRATDASDTPLPRIPAQRWRLRSSWSSGAFNARLDVLRAQRVGRVAVDETPTMGFTRVDAWAGWELTPTWQLQLVARNLTNAVIRDHTSFLKDLTVSGARSVGLTVRGQI